MTPELQSILTGALSLIVPAVTAVIVAYLGKVKRDLDSAFAKIRAHEDELGIKTTQDKNGVQHVSRDPAKVGSVDPHPISPKGD